MQRTKNIAAIITALFISSIAFGQNVNWAGLDSNKHVMAQARMGVEYGMIYGIGGGYINQNWLFPMYFNTEISLPFGDDAFDDKKIKMGGVINWYHYHNLYFSTNLQSIFRTYQNDFANIADFGADVSGVIGYYRAHVYVAGEVGFDKAIATRYEHSDAYLSNYPDAVSGWYEPASGGNFYYGLQLGGTVYHQTVSVRAGQILNEDFYASPRMPFYGEITLSIHF